MAKKRITPQDEPMDASDVTEREIQHVGGGEVFKDTLIMLNVRRCDSCGGDHDGLPLLPLPEAERLDRLHTHFFFCPTTGQRVMLQHQG